MSKYKNLENTLYIQRQWKETQNKEKLTVLDKSTGEPLAQCLMADENLIEQVLNCAKLATNNLKTISSEQRSHCLKQLYELVDKNKDEFINLIVSEAGKPYSYAQSEVERSLMTIKFGISEALNLSGESPSIDYGTGKGKMALTKRFPIGVVLCITPFNFPLNLAMHKIVPALASGCPAILKSAPQTPLTISFLNQIIDQTDLPTGAYQSLACDNRLAEKMVKDPRVNMLSFTGSDKVGWYLKSISGKKNVALELGGNAACLVDETAEIKKAAREIAHSAYLYAGQICISTQRILVHESIKDDFQQTLVNEIQKLHVGPANDKKTIIGPIIDKENTQRIQNWIKEAIEKGAQPILGPKMTNKNTLSPTLLTNTSSEMKVVSEEVFGPVATIESFKNFTEMIEEANNSKYGLQTGVYTQNLKNIKQAFHSLDVGGVICNKPPAFRVDSMPYGGMKDSGIGKEGVRYAIQEMTVPKLLVL